MTRLLLSFSADGSGHCLYSELLDLRELGPLHCRRASTLEFDAASQQWQVRTAADPLTIAYQHPSRATCLAWEQEHLSPA